MLDLNQRPPRVLIGTPHNGGMLPACAHSIMETIAKTPPHVAQVRWQPCSGSNIAENEAELVECAESFSADYLFSVENDMAFPGEALGLLLAHRKPIVGCTYPFKDANLLAKLIAEKLDGKDRGAQLRYMGKELDGSAITLQSLIHGRPEGDYVRQVEFIPMGLTLISMEAIRAVRANRTAKAAPALPDGVLASAFVHAEAYAPDYNAKRTITTTTDSTFCMNAREAGLEIWLDGRLSLLVEHIGFAHYAVLPEVWAAPEMMTGQAA